MLGCGRQKHQFISSHVIHWTCLLLDCTLSCTHQWHVRSDYNSAGHICTRHTHLHCRIIEQQHDQQNLQKWRLCQGKLQQERLLVKQLETEAAVLQMQDHARQLQDNAAYSDSDSQSPTGRRAQLATPLQELREANRGTSASWAGAAVEHRPSRRLSLPHQTASKGIRTTSSTLRRASTDGRAELPGPQTGSRQDLRRGSSPLRRASSASTREPGSGSQADAPAPEALPCMPRNRSSSRAESSRPSSLTPGKHPEVRVYISHCSSSLLHDADAEAQGNIA